MSESQIAPAPPTPSEIRDINAAQRSPEKLFEYFEERMRAIGVDPFKVPTFKSNYTGAMGSTQLVDTPFFEMAKNGNILINYPGLNNSFATYEANGQIKEFQRWRKHPLNIAKASKDKYGQPRSSGVQVFLTPAILKAIEEGIEIENLYLIEGEFKAWAGSNMGLCFIGITGIFNYKEKGASEPHPVIMEVIRLLKPKNIVYMMDADATVAPMADWQKNREIDLGTRLNDFYNAVTGFRSVYHHYVSGLYLVHPKEDFVDLNAKGLDDLVVWKKQQQAQSAPETKGGKKRKVIYSTNEIEEELLSLPVSDGKYFEVLDLAKSSISALRSHFYLTRDRSGCPNYFYQVHAEIIQDLEFTFNKGRFIFDEHEDVLVMTKHEDADRYFRLGTDYMKEIYEPDFQGRPIRKLVPWKKSEIQLDYVQMKKLKDFFKWIPKYDGPCNVPDNTDNFKLIHYVEGSKCYNLYHRISHVPEEGDCSFILGLLRHLFRDKVEMALDYLTLLYLQPTQQLPIIALVSRENKTGKSSFLKLLEVIFEDNATIIGNDELTDKFNADFASKLIIGVDEGLIEKRGTVEKIKAWSTSDKINIDAKHSQRHRINFFGKIIICSNNEDNFLPIDQEDTRFWVVKVNRMEGEEIPPRKRDELFSSQTPAFLHMLRNRPLKHENKTRHFFATNLIASEAKEKLKENSKDWLQSEVESWLKEQFLNHYLAPELYFSLDEILHEINHNSGAKFRRKPLERLLTEIYGLERKNSTYKMPRKVEVARANPLDGDTEDKKGRLFTFTASTFLNASEMQEMIEARAHYALPQLNNSDPLPGDELDTNVF